MAQQFQLPPGLTPQMLASIAAYFAQQQQLASQVRPKGILQPNQIRGINPAYQYQFQEYPKAMTPPPVTIRSEMEERTFRVREGQPLPWALDAQIAGYYQVRQYPVNMQPSQIVVNTIEEERARRAEWNLESGDRVAYPRWFFHASKPPQMVGTIQEEEALGAGWYPTLMEASDEALQLAANDRVRSERQAMIDEATRLGVKVEQSWGNKRIQEALDKAVKAKEAA